MEFIIKGGTVLTMGPGGRIRDGAVVIEDDRIVDVGKARELGSKYGRYEAVDARGCVIMPGLVNAHQHISMSLLRGYADDHPLKEWLEKYIWPLEAKMTGRDMYVGSLLTCAESLLGGVTTVNTMYHYQPDWNEAKAIADICMRGVVGHVCFSWRKEEDRRALEALFRDWHGKADGRLRASVDPHAPYTVDPDYLVELRALTDRYNERYGHLGRVVMHIHVAETPDEPDKIREAFGREVKEGVFAYLNELGVLGPDVVAAHCVALTDRDIAIMAEKGVKAVYNPVSNMKLASGISPVVRLLRAKVTVALGTDGPSSNNTADMFETMKFASLLQKVASGDPTALPARQVLEMATIRGAEALSWSDEIGSIEPGKKADIIVVDLKKPHLTPLYDEESHLVYAARSSDVKTVFVNGRPVVENGRLTTMSLEEIMEMAAKAREDLLSRLEG
ncbi:N-ethylammeline chlorohydrolase [Candidatus Bathyarchaeota archaeon ex4484_135]|nr:MAG: N-ethylammeline chlorohydrolase [Candidatus Bathyarchaeota archaeon ex4484_135]